MCKNCKEQVERCSPLPVFLWGVVPYVVSRLCFCGAIWYVLGFLPEIWLGPIDISPRLFLLTSLLAVLVARVTTSLGLPERELLQLSKDEVAELVKNRDAELYRRFEDKHEQLARAERLAEAIQVETISYDTDDEDNETDYQQFIHLSELFKRNYPLVHKHLDVTVINQYSRIYHWKGKDPSQKPYMLYAHMDVVPCPEVDQWSVPPFEG